MKIGIMGGTFDPVHNGHLMLGEYAYRQFSLDEIWFMPNGNPPHKNTSLIQAGISDRVEMTKLAIRDTAYFKLCLQEIDGQHHGYSWKTIQSLQHQHPDCTFYFIIGADSLFSIESWKHPERLISEVTILAAYRDDKDTPEEMYSQINYLNQKYSGDIRLLRTPVLSVSSHEIRRYFHLKKEVSDLIPEEVEAYIRTHHIYQGEEI